MFALFRQLRLWATASALVAIVSSPVRGEDPVPWKVVSQSADLTIYERPRKGSDLREFKATGPIAVAPVVVKRVLDDVESYPTFMPYIAEARIISQDGKSRVSYQRISPPLVGDRDYTVRVKFETRSTPVGPCFCNRWQAANELGPPPKKGVTRVNVTEGYWQLDAADGGRSTRATYFIFSDSGGSLPTSILNTASRTAIPKLFASVRKQTQLEKYSRTE